MKKLKIKSLSVLAASLVAILTVICLVGFSACDIFTSSSSSSSSDDDDDHVHIVTSWDFEEATCEEDGYQLGTCDVCGDAVMLVIPATGHEYVYEVIAEASCEEDGLQTGVCSKCGNEVTEKIPATGHDYVFETTVEATCVEEGSRTGVCSVCEGTIIEVIPATGHSWDDGTVTKEATEDEEGEIIYTCTVCGETKTETIPKVGVAEEDPDEGDDEDDGDDGQNDPVRDYSKVADSEGEHARVAGSADADGRSGNLSGVAFDGSAVTATLSDDGATWVLSGTSAKMDGDHANAFWVDETIASSHIAHEYIVFTVYEGVGEVVTMTTSDGKTRILSDATEESVSAQNWIVDITDHDETWYISVSIADAESNELYEYRIVLGDISSDYSYVTDVDGNYARIAGSADVSLDGLNVGKIGSVEFADSSVNAVLCEDGKTWTLSGEAGIMSEEQSEAFWVDEAIAADHVGHKYIVFGVFAGLDETVTVTTSTDTEKSWNIQGATEENVVVRKWIVDVEDLDDSWYMLVMASNDNGDTLYEYTIVLGDIKSHCELYGHTWGEAVVTDPTCTEIGCTTKTCSVCGATQKTDVVEALGHDYAEVWDWTAQSNGAGYDVTASLVDVCSRCGDKETVGTSSTVTSNEDGTYTAKLQTSDGEEYEDTTRVFVDADDSEDGTIVDIGMGTEYTPVYDEEDESTLVAYKLTSVPKGTTDTYVVVAGYIDGFPVSVGDHLSVQANNSTRIVNYIETLIFEEGVTSIDEYAFYYCTALKTVEFCDTISVIGEKAFYYCSALTEPIDFWDSLIEIGDYAFGRCSALTRVTFNEGLTRIGDGAFDRCTGLSGCLEIPSSVTYIGGEAFYQITTLTSIVIHGNTNGTTIGDPAFKSCSKVESLTLDGGVFTIEKYAFQSCNALTTLIIINGATFDSVADDAFYDADHKSPIETIYYGGEEESWNAIKEVFNASFDNIPDTCDIYYYSETEPDKSDDSDTLYWHWGEDGTPVPWDV